MQKEKTLLTTLSNFGNSSSVRFLCYRNIILFNGYCKNVANPLPKNNGICLEPAYILGLFLQNPIQTLSSPAVYWSDHRIPG